MRPPPIIVSKVAAALPLVALVAVVTYLVPRAPVKPGSQPTEAGAQPDATLDACIDRWLAVHELDAFGAPEGTMYAGGTPTFDETTGAARSRWEYLAAKHPGLVQACTGAHRASR